MCSVVLIEKCLPCIFGDRFLLCNADHLDDIIRTHIVTNEWLRRIWSIQLWLCLISIYSRSAAAGLFTKNVRTVHTYRIGICTGSKKAASKILFRYHLADKTVL